MDRFKNGKMFVLLQKLGRSFMLPIAVLPAAGLLLGIGASFTNPINLSSMGLTSVIYPGAFLYNLFSVMNGIGSAIFDNLPVIFAVGVTIGLTEKQKETAALASLLAFLTMNTTINKILLINGYINEAGNIVDVLADGTITKVLGITTLQTGVFGGIVVGIVVSILHNRFRDIKLPDYLAFFGGNRFVPIISVIVSIILGGLFSAIWPYIQLLITKLGTFVVKGGAIGALLFEFFKRLLIPFGLHHLLILPFWQTALGGTMVIAGKTYVGAQNILFAQLADPNTAHISREVAKYFSGMYPILIFGLPAACLAMYKNSKQINKKVVKSLLLSAALTSAITGITEPIVFPILFASPILYVVESFLGGICSAIVYLLNVTVGCTFSDGLIDLILFGVLPGNSKTSWIYIIIVGIVVGIVYYFLFDFAIRKFDLKTPGREDIDSQVKVNALKQDASELIVSGLGGKENIEDIDCCATRLRVEIIDQNRISESDLKNTGALGIVRKGKGIQVIYGPGVNVVKSQVEEYLGSDYHNSLLIRSPLIGKYIKLEDVPDEAFSKKMMGDGIAVDPDEEYVYAPADCVVEVLYPTMHAIGLKTKDDISILIHLGIDTVNLKGQGFEALVKQGDEVKLGTPLIKMNLDYLRRNAKSMISPIVITNLNNNKKIEIIADNHVEYNETIIKISNI